MFDRGGYQGNYNSEWSAMLIIGMVCFFALLLWVTFPLLLIGAVIGKNGHMAWLWLSMVWYFGCLLACKYWWRRINRLEQIEEAYSKKANN